MINRVTLNQIKEFFSDEDIDNEWMRDHTSINFSDFDKSVSIKIDNMNEQEYKWLKENSG